MKSLGNRSLLRVTCLVEDLRLDSIELGQIEIQHHFVAANQIDLPLDGFQWE